MSESYTQLGNEGVLAIDRCFSLEVCVTACVSFHICARICACM